MKKNSIRVLAWILVVFTIISTFPVSVFAEDSDALSSTQEPSGEPAGETQGSESSAVTEVATYDELVAALSNGGSIKLTADITVDTKLTVIDGTVIDLNGKTLYINVEDSTYGDVTIKNGNIILGKDDVHVCNGYFLVNAGKTLVVDGVKISSSSEGIKGYAVFHLKTGANLDLIDSELNISDNEYTPGYIVYAGESTATVDVVDTTVIGSKVNGIVHATTVIEDSTFTITDAIEHGINRSGVTITDSAVTISGGTGRGITAQHGPLVVNGTSTVTITDMGEATIELRNNQNLTIAESATVKVDVAVNNTTSGTVTGTVDTTIGAVAVIDKNGYKTLAEALAAATTMTGDVVVEILDKVTLNSALIGSYDSIKFVGEDADAEIYLDVQGYITATGKKVAFEGLTLSKSVGGFITNAGFMNVAFGIYDVTEVTYTNCTFANGAYASSGKVTYTGCTFYRSHDKYGLWAYGNVAVTVDGCVFDDYRGIKMYAENAAKTTDLTVKNTNFSAVDNKPAIVLTYGESVTLENNVYSSTGVFELDLDGAPNGTTVTSDVAPSCKNDNGACGVLVDGKIYTTVAQAAEVATSGSIVKLLHNSTENVKFAEGVELDRNGFKADGVAVAVPVAKIGEKTYTSLQAAIDAVQNGETIEFLSDITEALVNIDKASGVAFTIDGKNFKFTGEFEIGIGESIAIQNINFVASDAISPEYFIDSMDKNSNCILTIQNCTFTDTDYSTTAIGTHQPTKVVIDGCTTAGVASLLQNQGGYNITVKNTTVEGKRGISLGTVVGATVENVKITAADDKYGIRLNGEIANNTITIKDCKITAFIPVVVRKAQVENYTVVFDGTNTMNATNTDGLWCAIGATEYEMNGTMPTAPTGKVVVTLNDKGLSAKGVYGNYIAAKIGDVPYTSLQAAIDAVQNGDTICLQDNITQELGVVITDKKLTIDLNGKTFTVTKGDDSTVYRNFLINGSSVVTIKNGSIISKGNTNGGTSSGVWGSVRTEGAAKVTLTGLKLYNYRGNGLNVKACTGTTVTISDTEIYSQYGGGIEAAGGTIELTNVKVEQKGMWTAPYNSMAISVNGGGKVTVNSGTYSTECLTSEEANNQGTSHGPWVAGVLNSGGTLIINGGTFFNDNFDENSLATYARGAILADTSAKIEINGGTFNAVKAIIDITNNLGDANKNPSATIKGGTFSADPRVSGLYASDLIKIADGYEVKETNGVYTVAKAVAKIGNKYYTSIADAIAAAQNGDTVTIFAGEFAPINISNKNITIQGTVGANGELLTTIKGGNPAITGHGFNGTIKDIKIVDAWTAMYAEPAGNVTVDNVYVTGATYGFHLIAYSEGLTWTIQNSYMDLSWANSFGVHGGGDAAIVIKGNVFESTSPYYPDYGALPVNTFLPNVTVEENVFGENAKIKIDGSITDTSKINISKNYHADGVDKAFVEDSGVKTTILEYYADKDMTDLVKRYVQIGTKYYETLAEAVAAAQAGDEIILLADVAEDVTVPAGVIFNGNGKQVGVITAAGEITFKGHTKATNFGTQYTNTTINIIEGACLELTGTGRMVIGHGCTFNITGTITDAKTVDKATIQPSLIVAAGASFTGKNLIFNVTNAYVKFNGNSTSKNSNANGTFNFNVTNSIWEQTGVLAFYVPTSGMDPTFNLTLENSVLTTTSHLVFSVTKGEIVIDNSNVNVGTSRQIENRSTMTIKNGSVVNGAVATSSNAINPGTIIVENATYAVTGQFSGAAEGTGTLILKAGANVSVGSIVDKANIVIDATGMTADDAVNFTGNLSKFAGTLEAINNEKLGAKIVDGKIVLVGYVAKIDGVYYETLAEALTAAKDGETITLLWAEGDAPIAMNGSVFGKTVTITGTAIVDWSKGFLFVGRGGEGNGTVIFDGAILTSASNSSSYGIHVSGREKNTVDKYNGTLIIKNSTIELDYLINRGAITLENGATLTVKNGFGITGRPDSETVSGEDATATITLNSGSKLVVNNHNGMGLGLASPVEEGYGIMTVNAGATFETTQAFRVSAKGTMNVNGGSVKVAGTLTNNGTINVSGESTLNIAALTGTELNLQHGAIIKDSTVGGEAMLYGKVIFRGNNSFTMIYDYGNAYSTEYAEWIVEKGASLTLTEKARYGLGNGDKVTIYGSLEDALAAREDLTEADISFFTHGLVAMSNWDGENSLTVKDAYVVIGSNNSFGNSPKSGHTGTFNILFENAVLDASRITFYEASSKTTFTFNVTDAKIGTFMTRDADSVFTLINTKLLSTTTTNGTDEGNYHAGTLVLTNSSLTYSAPLVMEDGTLTVGVGSTLTAPSITGTGEIIIDGTGLSAGDSPIIGDASGFTGTIKVINNDSLYAVVENGKIVLCRQLLGKGTEEKPYLISNIEDLICFRDSVNAGETKYNASGVYVALADDIDMAEVDWSVNIGDGANHTFDGIFDGNGKTLYNLNSTETQQTTDGYVCAGLFGCIAGNAVIKNLTIENVSISTGDYTGNNAAAVVGFAWTATGSIENVTVKGNIQINASKIDGVGVIVGYAHDGALTVKNCIVDGAAITRSASAVNGQAYVGGVVGYAGGKVNLSGNTVQNLAVKANSAAAGGIAGIMLSGGTASDNTIKYVTLNSAHKNWQNAVGAVAGTFTGSITVENTTAENNSTNALVGVLHVNKPDAPLAPAQAAIGNVYYGTFAAAYAAAKDGETITLLVPVVVKAGETLTLNKNVTIVGTDNNTSSNFYLFDNRGELTITAGLITLTAKHDRGWTASSVVIANNPGGKLTVSGGTIEHLGGTDMAYAIDNLTNGKGTYAKTVINGGIIKSTYRAVRQFLNGVEAQNILTINGGTIEGGNKSVWMQDPSKNANTGTLTVGENAVIKGDVYLSVTEGSTAWPVEVSIAASAVKGKVLTSNVPAGYELAEDNGTIGVYNGVAKIGTQYYETLQAAIDAAVNGDIITLLANCAENVTVVQAPDVEITIDGAGKTMTGTITVNGKSAAYATAGLTIKNVNFVVASGATAIHLGVSGDNNTRYTSNVTIDTCTFTGTDKTAAGIKSYTGGDKNLTIKGCTATGMHSLAQLKNVEGVTVSNTTVTNGKNGISLGASSNAVISGSTINVDGYGVRADGDGAYDMTVKESTINAELPIVVRKNTEAGYELTLKDNTLTGNDNGYDVIFTAGDDGTYEAPAVTAVITGYSGKVFGYQTKIGDVYYATLADAIAAAQSGDTIELLVDITATEVILIDKSITINGNEHKVTSSATRVFRVTVSNVEVTLNDVNMVSTAVRVGTNDIRGISIDTLENVKLTLNNCSVDFTDASANDWTYAVNVTGGNKATLVINGGAYEGANVINVRGANNTVVVKDATLTSLYPNHDVYYGAGIWVLQNQGSSVEATGNTFNGANAVAFNVGTGTTVTESNNIDKTTRCVAKIDNVYYTSLEAAFAAAQNGDEVVILVAGEYALSTSGKNITITGAVDGVVFTNIGAKNMGGASVTFNNVTFTYANNSTYKGLQHAGNLVYNGCTFNGQVFLYGTSETFNNCTFNNTTNNYNVWTYGAAKVAFNGCTFNSAGKAVLIYAESAGIFNDVTVTGCTFVASTAVDGKAAIEMDSSLTSGIKLTIDAVTTAIGFGNGNVSGNSLWNNKKDNNTDANNDITVVVDEVTVLAPVTFVAKIGEIGYTSLADALEAAKNEKNIVIDLVIDATLDITAWDTLAIGGDTTETITINGNGNTLTFNKLNSDWNHIATNNNAKLILNNMTITDSGKNNGPWNRYDLNFACDVELNNVTATKALAFKADATLNTVTINETGDNYAIWIQPNGQEVAIDGLTVTSAGRGIKIDQQYVDAPAKVKLSVANAKFTTAKKAAILVKSTAGADIALTNVDISGVAADTVNAVWNDADAGTEYGDITVTGGTLAQEDATEFAAILGNGTSVKGYYKTLQAAINACKAGDNTIKLLADNAEDVTIKQVEGVYVTIDGNGKTYSGTITIHGNARYEGAETLTIQNFKFESDEASHYFIDSNSTASAERYAHNVTVKNSTFTATGAAVYTAAAMRIRQGFDIAIENVTTNGLHSVLQGYGIAGVSVKTLTATNMKNGISLGTSTSVTIENATIVAQGYGVRADGNAKSDATITNSNIMAAQPIIVRNLTGTGYDLKVIGGGLVATGDNEFAVIMTKGDNSEALAVPEGAYKVTLTNVTGKVYPDSTYVAKVNDKNYASLADAIAAAQAGETIVFLADITEDVTINKSLTIDGAGMTYTGKMTLKADTTIQNVNFDGKGFNGYAVETRGADYLTVEDCTAKNYGYGFVQLASGTVLTTVKNVTVSNMNYGVKVDYSNAVVLENVTLDCAVAGLLNSNYGAKTITIKDSDISILGTWTRNDTIKTTYVFEGENTVDEFITDATIDNFKLAAGATLTAPAGQTVTTDVANYSVKYADGKYFLKANTVAIGKVTYATLADAIAAAKAGDTITFLADITEDVTINKSLTIDGAEKTFTGKMNVTANVTIKNVNFDGKGYNGYAIETRSAADFVIEDCTAKNYGYGFLQVASNNNTFTVRNVVISDVNYGIKIDYSNEATIENVTIDAAVAGILNSNHGTKTITIKNSDISILGTWKRNDTIKTTFVFEGANVVDEFKTEAELDSFKLVTAESTLTAPAGLNVTTNVAHYNVEYKNGAYVLVPKNYVAQIGENGPQFESLAEAIKAAQNGDTIKILKSYEIDCNSDVFVTVTDKDITIDFDNNVITVNVIGASGNRGRIFYVKEGAKLTISQNSGNGGIVINNGENPTAWMFHNAGEMEIYGGKFILTAINGGAMFFSENGGMVVNGGTFYQYTSGWMFNTSGNGVYKITVNAGTFNRNFLGGADATPAENPYDEVVLMGETCLHFDKNTGTWTVEDLIVEIDDAVAATCTSTGLTEGSHCSKCGKVIVKQEEVPAIEHTEETIPAVAPTFDNVGYTEGKKCSVCGETTVAPEVIPAKKAVAQIGNVKYETLEAAIKAAQNGDRIVVLADIAIVGITVGHSTSQTITIDLNGHTITSKDLALTAYRTGTTLTLENGTILGNSSGGTIKATYGGKLILGAKLTVKSGGSANAVIVDNGMLEVVPGVTVNGGIDCINTSDKESNKVDISGGYFNGNLNIHANTDCTITGGTFTDADVANYINTNTCIAVTNTNGTYTVKKMVTIKVANANVIKGKDAPDFNYEIVDNGWNIPAGTFTITLSSNYETSATTGEQFAITAEVATTELNDFYFNVVEGKLTVVAGAAMIGGTYYATVAQALAAANSGDTVVLVADDVEEAYVMLTKGITLDLNGKTLTSDYLVAFNGNHVVDTAATKGLLNVDKDNISLAKDNGMMPVYNGDGYLFLEMNMTQHKLESENESGFRYKFRPSFGKEFNTLFANGAADNEIKIILRLTWTTATGDMGVQEFVYSEEMVKVVYTNNKAFELTVNGIQSFNNLSVSLVVLSDLDVECVASNVYTFNSQNS